MAQVTIYTRQYCDYCAKAKALLKAKSVEFTEIDATGNAELRAEMVEKSGRNTFPQIFIGQTHIGGCDDLHALDRSGQLDTLLNN